MSEYFVERYIDLIIEQEKNSKISPFVKTRILSGVEAIEYQNRQRHRKMLSLAFNALFVVTTILSVYIGKNIGEVYLKSEKPIVKERVFTDDSNIETLFFKI